MCGITGFLSKNVINLNSFYNAHSLLNHRGPDGEGFCIEVDKKIIPFHGKKTPAFITSKTKNIISAQPTKIVLGHHRLKIIDLSDHSHQPFICSDSKVSLVFNGEIYNYKEIRSILQENGHLFVTEGDTEVVLKAYLEWGTQCFEKLNGMWALAIHDTRSNITILSRDHFGIKPIFYFNDGQDFLFASEVKFIRSIKEKLNLNYDKAIDYLNYSRIHTDTETLYQEIRTLSPASYMVIDSDLKCKEHIFWTPKQETTDFNLEDTIEKLSYLFNSSIDLRLRSDVPVGALLSGGLDSTSIVGNILSRSNNSEFHSFSAIFDEKEFSEISYIEKTLQKYPAINCHFIKPQPETLSQDLDTLLKIQEFPIRSLAVYSQYKIYQYIKQNTSIIVLLNGQGSDEIFGGYSQHYYYHFLDLMLEGKISQLKKEAKCFIKNRNQSFSTFTKNILYTMGEILDVTSIKNQIGSNKLRTQYKMSPLCQSKTMLGSILKTNLSRFSLPEYLLYEDKNSMAFSLESRLPFLDYRLVNYAFSIPDALKINEHGNKFILREAVKEYIPVEVLNRKDKMGFISPQELWQKKEMLNDLKATILDGSPLMNLSVIDLERSFNKYLTGKDNDWSFWWRVYCFKCWRRIALP